MFHTACEDESFHEILDLKADDDDDFFVHVY